MILEKIENQKRHNFENFQNLKKDQTYKLEDTYDPKVLASNEDPSDYENDDFEVVGSDDESDINA